MNFPAITFSPIVSVLLFVALIWASIWKGVALWKAARNSHLIWFIALLLVNTLGLLEILYIFVFSKKQTGIGGN